MEMTKQQAKENVEATGAKVLAVRMKNGKPLVTIPALDYMDARTAEGIYETFNLAMR